MQFRNVFILYSVMCGPKKPFPATIIPPITVGVWCYLKCCSVQTVSRCKPDLASPALSLIMDQSDWIIHWLTERLNDPLSHPALIFPSWTLIIRWIHSPVCDVDFSEAFEWWSWRFSAFACAIFWKNQWWICKSCRGLVWLLWSNDWSSSGLIVYFFLTMWWICWDFT